MARSKIKHFKGFSVVDGDIRVKLDMHRFEEQFRRAQYQLDGAVMNSMVPFMPMITGSFINTTRAASAAIQGSGEVYAAYAPQGRYLYMGKVMVDRDTGKGPYKIPTGPGGEYVLRFRKGAKLVATDRPLKYSYPKAQSHWFDAAKKKDGKKWVRGVKETAGGGKRG
jgi:hypothetical protein|nr:MAG TPA: Minor capsid protein [Caudoviricetes sp.]